MRQHAQYLGPETSLLSLATPVLDKYVHAIIIVTCKRCCAINKTRLSAPPLTAMHHIPHNNSQAAARYRMNGGR